MPLFSLALGAIMFTAFAIGGSASEGAGAFAVMAAMAALFGFGSRRSETLAGIGGSARDERWAMIDLRATALAGMVLVTVVIGSWLYEVANGRDGEPYAQLGAVGGVAYVLAVAVGRLRG